MTDHLPAEVLFPLDRPPTRTAFEVWVWVKGVEWDVAQYHHPPGVFVTDMLTKAVREICMDGYGLHIPPDLVPIYVPRFLAAYRQLRESASGLQGPAVPYIDATIAWFERHYPLPPPASLPKPPTPPQIREPSRGAMVLFLVCAVALFVLSRSC